MQVIPFNRNLTIKNISALPTGTGCRYLLCIPGEGTALIAKAWCRKVPEGMETYEVLIDFAHDTDNK